ncbi:MAG: aldo/keto reductase [SAR324 cluster bacterium]|nr:aldo/keto reductase [SAR324 cluster bacterium]
MRSNRITLPNSELHVSPLCLGGNVFGWSADVNNSEQVLDHFVGNGVNFVDTPDMYSHWVEGHSGGESESIIGNWQKKRGNRNSVVIATKVAKLNSRPGLSPENIIAACDDSLNRLQTDYIDLYYAHEDDPDTPIEATLEAFNSLIQSGKVRYIAASNFSAPRLQQSLEISERLGYARYIACQDHYNLLERDFEDSLKPALEQNGLSELPYFGLAKGFLTGKYRPGTSIESVRASGVTAYQNDRGWGLLGKLDELAQEHQTSLSAISLAWLRAQPTVAAPIASARNLDQLKEIMPLITLTEEELGRLT